MFSGNTKGSGFREVAPHNGFALILVVSLLSFLVVLLVAIASLVKIEYQVDELARSEALARQNALVGLNVAIGRLQEYAGPDQRVTVRSDHFPTSVVDKSKWTGAIAIGPIENWPDRTSPVDEDDFLDLVEGWLVSGENPDPASSFSSAENLITLVGEKSVGNGSPADIVRVETVPITTSGIETMGSGSHTIGRYAYWVGDEGLKARVNLVDPYESEPANSEEGVFRHQVVPRTAVEYIWRTSSMPVVSEDYWYSNSVPNSSVLANTLLPNQLAFDLPNGPSLREVISRFHDVTTFSSGVIADTENGGLRRDLSAYLEFGDIAGTKSAVGPIHSLPLGGGATFGLVKSWVDVGLSQTAVGAIPQVYRAHVEDDPEGSQVHGINPIISRFSIFVGASYARIPGPDAQARVHIMPVIALWNPYNVDLSEVTYEFDLEYPFAVELDILHDDDFDESTPPAIEKLGPFSISGPFSFEANGLDFKAGECRVLSIAGQSPGIMMEWQAGMDRVAVEPGWNPQAAIYIPVGAAFAAGPITGISISDSIVELPRLTMSLVSASGSNAIQVFDGSVSNDQDPGEFTSPANTSILDSGDTLYYEENLARGWSLNLPNASGSSEIDHRSQLAVDRIQIADDDSGRNRGFVGLSWMDPVYSDPGGVTKAILFDVPARVSSVLGIGQLRHIHLPREPVLEWAPRYLFDVLGTDGGALLDQYFFTGLDSSLTFGELSTPEFQMPNARLQLIRSSGDPVLVGDLVFSDSNPIQTAAARLMMKGPINVNSLSLDVWRANLAGLVDVGVATADGTSDPSVNRHPFSRFVLPLTRSYVPKLDGLGDELESAPVWGGYRRLSEGELLGLVEEVVVLLATNRASGGPFRSIRDFVESDILAQAIVNRDLNSTITLPPTDPSILAEDAAPVPGALTQWDLLTVLGPSMVARSDTFLIRAYGEGVSPNTNETNGTAWCEAIVQRLPEYVDPTENEPWDVPDEDDDPTNFTFGRRFEIVYFRWLSPDDI